MVRLISLQAQNFKILRIDSPIQFGNGITLITGLNESGKSSVLDAILYCLFGRVTRPPKARTEDIIAYGAKDANLTLDFEVEDRRFRVTRHLHRTKPSQARLEELASNGALQPLATGQEKVNEEVVKLLGGITYHEIVSSTVVAQKELNKLIEINKEDRKRTVNAFLNLESFNAVTTELGEQKRDLEGTASRTGKVRAETEKLEILRKELEQFKLHSEEKSKLLQENSALDKSIKGLETQFKTIDQQYNTLHQYETALKTKEGVGHELSGKRKLREDYKSRHERLSNEISDVRTEIGKFDSYSGAEPLLSKIQKQVETAKIQSLELSTAEHSLKTLEQQVGSLQRNLGHIDEVKVRNQAELMRRPILPYVLASVLLFATAFAALMAGILPVAIIIILAALVPMAIAVARLRVTTSAARNQSVLGDLRYLDTKHDELASAQEHCKLAKEKLGLMERELVLLCKELEIHGPMFRVQNDIGILETAQRILEDSAKDIQTRDGLQIKLRTLTDEMDNSLSQSNLNDLEKEIEAIARQLQELPVPQLPEGIVYTPEALTQTLTIRDEISRQLATAQVGIDKNLKRIIELDSYLTQHTAVPSQVSAQQEVVSKLERELKVVRRAVEGVQATAESLRNRIRPNVQAYMGSILPALTSSKYKAAILNEDYNLQVWDPEAGEYRPKEVFSGGTEDQFLLAMRLAFALALLPEAKGQKPEFVFLDEPLGSSDDVRRSGIVNYLAQDLSRKFKQIFIISHVAGLEEHVRDIITLEDGRIALNRG